MLVLVQLLTYLYLLPSKTNFIILASSLPLSNWISDWIYPQLGLGHTNHVREPTLVTVLQGKNIRQISAGRCHSAAWTAPPVPPRAPGEGWNTHAPAPSLSAVPSCTVCLPVSNCIQTSFWNHQTPHNQSTLCATSTVNTFTAGSSPADFIMKQSLSAYYLGKQKFIILEHQLSMFLYKIK